MVRSADSDSVNFDSNSNIGTKQLNQGTNVQKKYS